MILEGHQLLEYLMDHFSMTRDDALACMREHNQSMDFLED